MRYAKWVVVLVVVIAVVVSALPALADDPFGGPPSFSSGNGSTTWGAIYVGNSGCWAGPLAAGASMWFKADTSPLNLDGVPQTLLVWLDDELSGATKPSGAAVLGTAYNYFVGTTDDFDSANRLGDQEAAFVNGFAFRVFDPDALAPNFAYATPNAWLLTTSNGTAPNGDVQPEGWGTHNAQGEPHHLLWYEGGSWSGWAYVQVYNQMLQSGTFTICTKEHLRFDRYKTPTPGPTTSDPPASTAISVTTHSPVTTFRLLQPVLGPTATTIVSSTVGGATRLFSPLLAPLATATPAASATPEQATPAPTTSDLLSPTPASSDSESSAISAPTQADSQTQPQTVVPASTPAPTTGAADANPTTAAEADTNTGAAPTGEANKPAVEAPQPAASAPQATDAASAQPAASPAMPAPPPPPPPPAREPPPMPTPV